MGVSSHLEFITVLFGWVMYDNVWSVLSDTGIVYAPFIVIVLRNIMDARKGGDDEGSAAIQSLKKNEVDVVVAIVVMVAAAVPFTDVELGQMSYVRPTIDCAVAAKIEAREEPGVIRGDSADAAYGASLATLDGQTGRIPLWWGFVHTVSKAMVSGVMAAIPCTHDVTGMATRLGGAAVDDGELIREVANFRIDCHQRAVSCVMGHSRCKWQPGLRNPSWNEAMSNRGYMGWRKFVESPGFYPSFQSRNPVEGWPAEPDGRDRGYESGGGHPTCAEWWADAARGLRGRLLASIPAEFRDELIYDPGALLREEFADWTDEEREDHVLRTALAEARKAAKTRAGSTSLDPGLGETWAARENWLGGMMSVTGEALMDFGAGAMAALGGVLKAPGNIAAGMAIREGMPMFLALLLMVFVTVLPVLMVFSRYEPGTLLVLTLVFFGLQFVYVLWGLAFWVDQHLYAAMAGSGISPISSPIQAGVMLWMQRFLYLVFPMIWLAGLGWVGVRAEEAFGQSVGASSRGAAEVAQSGGDTATSLAQRGATKGAKG